ncbi:TetR/AcrR family transcriptional regulator [Streptomyces sp. NPDC002992]|uniref:TetR/AcrR family transcriptional regulator n=1 Tax=Streptomyces sp. NPDC002992 TaxID=3154273 RepID=UPI0033B10CE4
MGRWLKASGLTHGGFYKQFASKEALIDEATAHAFDELTRLRNDGLEQHAGQRDAAQRALIDTYLSIEHRDSAANGCPAAALASDMARETGDREARRVYTEGVGPLSEEILTTARAALTETG